jgi:elongation factor Ts
MAEITAKLVNELRAKTGQAMMECKKALVEVEGDLEKAIDYFRKKGVKASLGERTASEGRVFGALSADKTAAAIIELNCNTDFTAKSEPFSQLGAKVAQALVANPSADVAANSDITAGVTQLAQTTGENVRVGRNANVKSAGGKCGLYMYAITGKIGVIMSFTGSPSDELITDLGGHIAFSKPLALTRDGISPELVEKERNIAVEQAKATGKPQQIAEKIAEGKLNAFFKEQTLLDQDFFNAAKFKGSIQQLLKQNNVTLEKYVRLEVGQA